ncbi:NAD(P)H-dependent oxidoreductase [Malaciobacter sp. WC5094]
MNKTLIILAHDDMDNSVLNSRFKKELENQENIIYRDLNALYPNYDIDVQKEQELLKDVSKVVFQFPMYWYSLPSSLKNWIDKVFSYGYSYIIDENGAFTPLALKDKKFQVIATMGAKEESFVGEDRLSVKECLNSCFYTAKMLGMKELKPLFFYGAAYDKLSEEILNKYSNIIKKELIG